METVAEPLVSLTEEDQIEFGIDIPGPEEFVACTTCGHRSYMHFYFSDDLMSFCGHHGAKGEGKLISLGASIVADYRDRLIENRLQGAP